jgi:hypothetical protein
VCINTGRLGYSLRGRRGLSVQVGNTTIRRLILEERKQFRLQERFTAKSLHQNSILKYIHLFETFNVVYFLEHNVFDFI